jgi:preprotein translocase subunit SecD
LIDLIVIFFFTKPLITVLAGMKYFGSGNRWSGFSDKSLGIVKKAETGASI